MATVQPVEFEDLRIKLCWGEIDMVPEPMAKGDSAAPEKWILKGFMTSEALDADGQIIEQDGIDWTPFDRDGIITDGHPCRSDNIVGCKLVREPRIYKGIKGTWLECELYQDEPRAKMLWDRHRQMCKGATRRGLGFSVEGWAKDVRGNRVVKSVVDTVAIDPRPKNPISYAMPIAASIGAFLHGRPHHQFPALMKAIALAADPRSRQVLQLADGVSLETLAAARLVDRAGLPWDEALSRARSTLSNFGVTQ